MLKILDRYVLKNFLLTLSFSLIALYFIFLIVDLLERLNTFSDHKVSFLVIAEYYINFFPQILKILTPVAMLISTLFTIGRLSTQNEITAMKSGGMSLYRLMLPLVIASTLLSFGHLYFNGWIVPKANEKKINIERQYLQQGGASSSIYNLYFRDSPLKHIIMDYYNSDMKMGNNLVIEDYDSEVHPRLLTKIEAQTFQWDSIQKNWLLTNVIRRNYSRDKINTERIESINVTFSITHEQIYRLRKSKDEMNFDELIEYIHIQEKGGKDIRKDMSDYYGQWAYPFANIIVVIFGVPFASIRKKGGIAVQIGAALIISFTYLVCTKLFQTLGQSMDISPILSGWGANIIFLFVGIINILKTRS